MKNEQPKSISTFPKSEWRIWLYGAVLFAAIFIGIKEVSKFLEKYSAEKVRRFDQVDQLPSFPNGEKAFAMYIQRNIRADADAKGRVIASFVVDKNGSLTNVKVLRGLSREADQAVIRVLEGSPKWIPGTKNWKAVNVAFTLSVNFDK